jgi:hypothetical protein
MRRALAAVALLTVLLAGCGGDSDEAEPSRATTTTAGAATPGSVDTNFTGKDSERFCTLLRNYNDKFAQLGSPLEQEAQRKTLAQEIDSAINEARAAAPPEIKGDVQVVAAALSGYIQELAKVNYDVSKVSFSSPGVVALQKPEVQASGNRLNAYLDKVCGITVPPAPSTP